MSGYYVSSAARARIRASFDALTSMGFSATEYLDNPDFNPSQLLTMIDAISGETMFLHQYVTQEFLTADNSTNDD